jgi:hypothetical protein
MSCQGQRWTLLCWGIWKARMYIEDEYSDDEIKTRHKLCFGNDKKRPPGEGV